MKPPVTVLSTEWEVHFKEWDDREYVFRYRGGEEQAKNIANGLWGIHSIQSVRLSQVQRTLIGEKTRDRRG